MKLRKLHIEDYKMFKDFDISFVDENDEALPIVVLAGVNGSGKTTLLECLNDYSFNNPKIKLKLDDKSNYYVSSILYKYVDTSEEYDVYDAYRESKPQEKEFINNKITEAENNLTKNYQNNIIYFSVGSDNIENIKETIRQKYIDRAFEIDKPSEALKELQEYIKDIFEGLDLTFNLSDIRYNEKKVLFKDNNGVEFDIDKLSTGEKTLLSKVLYLYFQGYKDKVLLIDEPELSLHPSWQNKVLKIYENFALKNNCQIIIATHSPHIIGSAKSEYIRLLVKEDDKIKVVDNFTNTYGLKFGQILTEVMGVEHLRPVEVDRQLSKVKSMIVQNEYDSDEFKKEWNALEELLGKEYLELKLLKVEIASRRKNVSSK